MYKKISRIVLVVLVLISLIHVYFISTLSFNYDFDSFFPKGDQDVVYYKEFREKFENDNDYLLIGIKNEEGIFQEEFLNKIHDLSQNLDTVTDVQQVLSLTTLNNQIVSRAGLFTVPFIHLDKKEFDKDSSLIYQYEELIGTFVSADAKSTVILLQNTDMIKITAGDRVVEKVEQLIDGYNFDEVHIAGKIKAQKAYVSKMQKELAIFIGLSSILIVAFLYTAYRSLWGIVLPLVVVFLSAIWILGIMGITNKPIDLMTVLLPTIMLIVGMSDVVHIISKYLDELRQGKNKIKALQVTFKEVGLATLLTSLTTAIGFLTLISADIMPIRQFGIYTAIGVIVAFFLAFTFLPAVLLNLPKPKVADKVTDSFQWKTVLHPMFGWVLRNRKFISIGAIVLTVGSIALITRIQVDAKLIDEVKEGDPLKDDFLYFERTFSGVRPFELAFTLKDSTKSLFDYEVMQEMEKVQTYFDNVYGVNNILSPVSVVKTLNRSMNGGNPSYYTLPSSKKKYNRIKRLLKKFSKRPELQKLISNDKQQARMSGKMNDVGSLQVTHLNSAWMEYKANNPLEWVDVKVTGSATLIDKSNYTLTQNMLEGLGIAFLIVAVIMGILYKSLRIVLIALVPNVIPLLLLGALMGMFDINLNMSISIIFTIAFGIAVDDTIHFMSKLKLELSKGKSLPYAIKRTFISTGKAIIVTSIILSSGFLTLIFSSFNGTFFIGLFISLTLLFAVFADLLLIPVLLLYFYKEKKTTNA
ncbi:MAG: MMPL family transporter [Cytophagales bacterium]|nr:MMPL family transporter [Cytophagales bacterium]